MLASLDGEVQRLPTQALMCRTMIDEELSPDKHLHKPIEASASKPAAAAAALALAASKGSGPLTVPVPKTDLSAGWDPVCFSGL